MSSANSASVPPIVRFYSDPDGTNSSSLDPEGRSLEELWHFDDAGLEYNHDYIQVLFPLPEPSPFNPWAPRIDQNTRDAFIKDKTLRDRLLRSFQCMATFYGFDYSESEDGRAQVRPKTNFRTLARRNWLKRMDHNHLRISRIIRCLRVLGLEPVAIVFHQALVENAEGVGSRSLMYWERAARRPLHLAPDEDDESAPGIDFLRTDS